MFIRSGPITHLSLSSLRMIMAPYDGPEMNLTTLMIKLGLQYCAEFS